MEFQIQTTDTQSKQTTKRVTILPPELANQIAAGEVVERPSSVVKELIENSIDAGATRLEVHIENGGRDRILVIDDGCGMERDDALRALERHATSKISSVDDLFEISTLGFRGEAIPSIASVSRMKIQTRTAKGIEGTELLIEGGHLQEIGAVGMASGTRIEVEKLFFNTPARLKFLKTQATESRHITESLIRVALARPDLRILLKRDGKVKLDVPSASNLKDRILTILGRDVYDDLYRSFDYPPVNGVSVAGYFSKPSHRQRSAKNIYTFVNGRYVVDKTIRAAVRGAYGTLLEKGKFPSVVLFISVPYQLVDINVHPAKTEVRFNDTNSIYRATYHALADELARAPWLDGIKRTYYLGSGADNNADNNTNINENSNAENNAFGKNVYENNKAGHSSEGEKGDFLKPLLRSSDGYPVPGFVQHSFAAMKAGPLPEAPRLESFRPDDAFYFSNLKVIGQFKRQYILCEDAHSMVIIDQHAAHERIRFEALKKIYESTHKETQPLLFPLRLEFDAIRATTLEERLDYFKEAGFEIEPFGGTTFVLKGVPSVLKKGNHKLRIQDAIDDLENIGTSTRFDEAMHSMLSRLACHSAVRGPTDLNNEECLSLLEQMDQIDFKGNCPHGRPVYFRISLDELEMRFDRK